MICSAPDYLPLSFYSFISHFLNLFTFKSYNIEIKKDNHKTILGYSCRSLFYIFMDFMSKKNDNLTIVTTPIHHTSYRNIIEKFVKPENIHIIKMNKNYNKIDNLPSIDRCDVVIITHLFGQDLILKDFTDFKKKHNCLFVEDRVQGGKINKKSDSIFDISFYSCGMDKRPVALGGGFVNIKKHSKNSNELNIFFKNTINSYPKESRFDRFLFLLKKIPTYFLYNNKLFIYLFIKILNIFNFDLIGFAKYYRKKNPGFEHNTFLKNPSEPLLKSIHQEINNSDYIENLYSQKFNKFKSLKNMKKYIKWYNYNNLLTPYNTFYIDKSNLTKFKNYMKKHNICVVDNPTYKIFNHSYEGKIQDEHFNDSLIYLPSLANMSDDEMKYLIKILNNYENSISRNNF